MPKFAVVIRHLPGSRPVTCTIIDETTSSDVDDMDHYLRSMAEDAIRRFKNDFPEFRRAAWYIDLLYGHSNTPYETIEIEPEK